MADQSAKIQITPKVIDLGDKVIQMTHVTSAGHGTFHPLRPLGLLLILAAVGLVGFEVLTRGMAAFALKSGGSLQLWLGFAAAGIGLFLVLYARRQLVIRTADGARTLLPSGDDTAAAAIVGRIRDAMEAAGSPAPIVSAYAPALGGAPAPDTGPGLRGGGEHGGPPAAVAPAPIANQPAYTQPLGGARRAPEALANGHGGYSNGTGRADAGISAETGAGVGRRAGTQPASPQRGPQDAPAFHVGAAMQSRALQPANSYFEPIAQPPAAVSRDDGSNDLLALMDHVRRADVQHKDALLDLLKIVDDHYRGRASREDAVAHWRSFADYVMQYLADVDGMMAQTERFGRHMLAR